MMTYQEIKDRLSKCEYTLKCIKDGTIKDTDQKTVKKLEILKESLGNQLKEQEAGMVVTKDAGEAEKLAKKGVNVNLKTEGPHQTTYIKVSKKDYDKAIGILDSNIDPTYAKMDVVDDDGDDNVIIYFNFRTRDGGEPGEDVEAFIYDAAMDLKAKGVNVTGSSHDIDETKDINDPVLMKLRALQSKIAKKKYQKPVSSKHSAILSKLQTKRDQVMRDMEQEAEPEGGPIADKYGDMLNKIDAAIAKAKGTKSKSYDDTFNEGQDDIFSLGYDLDATQYLIDYLKFKYKEGQDYELHTGRGDTHPNAITLINPEMEQDKELVNLLMAAGDEIEGPMDENKDISNEHLRVLASKAGKAVVKAIHDSGDEVARAKIKDVYASALSGDSSPEAFTVHIIYKNDSEVSYRFQIIDNTLYLLADNKDIKISDIGFKPSGEPFINTELVRNEISKYFKQMKEMTDQEFADAKEADRLANHPEKDKLIAIQQLIAKEKGLKEVDVNEEQPTVFDDESMDALRDIILKYVKDPNDAEKAVQRVDDFGLDSLSPELTANLERDPEFKAWYNKLHYGSDTDTDYTKRRREEDDYYDADQAQKDDEEDYERGYDDDGLPLGENALGFYHIKKLGDKAASHIDNETRRDSRYTFGNRPYQDDQLRYQIAKKLGYDVDSLLKEREYAAGKGQVNVYGYQTRHFDICPGAVSLFKRVLKDKDKDEDDVKDLAIQHDYLFLLEKIALDINLPKQYNTIKAVLNRTGEEGKAKRDHFLKRAIQVASDIYELGKKLGLDQNTDLSYIQGHIEKINDALRDEVNEESELDKITKAKRLIKQQAPAMNKLPQDDPKRKAFIDKVKQINQKHKELLDKEDNKVSGIGKDQELDEGRGDMDMIKGIIKDRANESGFSEREEAAEVIGGIADEYMISLESLKDFIDEGESDLYENKLEEATDLYDRNGIQITRFAGKKGLMLQINIGGKYIVVSADEFNDFIRALASIKDDVRDMKLQQPRDRYEQSEIK